MAGVTQAWRRAAAAGAMAAALAGCAALPAPRLSVACGPEAAPQITLSPDGKTAHMTLRVLTYNVEGLGWPIKSGRDGPLAEIGRRLAAQRRAGDAPDVVLFQEVLSPAADRAVAASGYPARVAGPSPWNRRDLPADAEASRKRSWRKGELGVPLTSGGLAIASRYPIAAHKAEPFSRGSCAGLDCLANKGALYVRLNIPGVPEPVEVFNSHLNSSHHSKVPKARALIAHNAEARELADFIDARHEPQAPVLLGGDFNVRHSPARFGAVEPPLQPLTLVHRYCLTGPCELASPLKGPTPWLETEDLQFFRPGERVAVRPVAMSWMFDGRAGGPVLSDHSGLLVTYDLSWPVDETSAPVVCKSQATGRRS